MTPMPNNNRTAPRQQYPIMVRTWVLDNASNQYFEVDQPAIGVSGGPITAGDFIFLDANGKIDPSFLYPTTGIVLQVNGINNPDQALLNLISGANITLVQDAFGGVTISATGTVSVSFDHITSGTNIQATMVVGTGATLTVTGTGVIEATELATNTAIPVITDISAPTHAGQILISQPGNATAIWADPQVQGLYAAGSSISSPPAYTPPTTIQPVLVGGEDCNGNLQNFAVTTGGDIITVAQDQETNIHVLRFAATTGVGFVTNATAALIPMLSIRPKVGSTGVTFTFRTLKFLSDGHLTHFQLLLNPALTGASFANVDPASGMQQDAAATSYTGGRLIDAEFVGADSQHSEYEFHFGFSGSPATPDTITLVFAPITGNRKTAAGCSFVWDEQAQCL
jgi:hypothetical protein